MIPRNPLNSDDVDGNTMAWMANKDPWDEPKCLGCGNYMDECSCEDDDEV